MRPLSMPTFWPSVLAFSSLPSARMTTPLLPGLPDTCPARLHAPIRRNPKANRERNLRRKAGETGPAARPPDTSALRRKHRGGPNDSPEKREPVLFPRPALRTLYRLLTSHRTDRDRMG